MTLHHHVSKVNVDSIRATFCQHKASVFIKTLGTGIASSGRTFHIDKMKCAHCGKVHNIRKESN
jgi:hypothetical protein